MSDVSLHKRFEHEERTALEELRRARARFNDIIAQPPGPARDLQIQQVGAEVRALNHSYTVATKRLINYLLSAAAPGED
jgi:hypothetical protein